MIESIVSILNQGLGYIVPMIILLGLLIFVHELGHFLAAKYYKVRVETFSLGFGPKIIQFRKGDTLYCVCALPLGGYVKMFGDEPGKEIQEEDRQASFLHKPVGQRIVIALAGPIMNLLFAGVLFQMIAHVGDKALSPIVGEISINSHAYQQGFRNYDEIQSVNGLKVETWDEFKSFIENSAGSSLQISLVRQGAPLELSITPEESLNDNIFSTKDTVGKIRGLNSKLHLPVVGVNHASAFDEAGFKSGDHIMTIDDETVKWFRDIRPMVIEALQNGSSPLKVKIKRFDDFRTGKNSKEIDLYLNAKDFTKNFNGIFIPEAVIAEVQKDSPAFTAGLLRQDVIKSINGNDILSFDDIVKNVSSYDPDGDSLKIGVLRDGQSQIFEMRPNMNSLEGAFGAKENRYTIGVVPLVFAIPQTFNWKSTSFIHAAKRAAAQTWHWTKLTVLSFVRILQNKVSSKNLSGFISIGQVAHQSWQIGISPFLKIMAIISINLFILNLLPIPILDGGHLVLFTLEAIKGAPISLKKVEMAQQIGFLIIIFLMAFALFNDFSRIFGS